MVQLHQGPEDVLCILVENGLSSIRVYLGDGGLKFNLGRTSKNGCVVSVVGLSIWRMDKITPIFSEPGSCDDDTLRLGKKHSEVKISHEFRKSWILRIKKMGEKTEMLCYRSCVLN